jgi:hypothetical protein
VFMGAILSGEGGEAGEPSLSARVLIDGYTYSLQDNGLNVAALDPVNPNMCDQDWIVDYGVPVISSSVPLRPGVIRPTRIYYAIKNMNSENRPVSEWVDHRSDPGLEAVEESPNPEGETIAVPLQKKRRKSPGGTSDKHG